MEAPMVHYVTTRDDYEIAYTVSGSGFPVVFLPAFTNHVVDVWTDGFSIANLLKDLSARYRLINYDSRGMGMSTRELTDGVTLDAYFLDLETVLESLGLDRFVLIGPKNFALLAVHYALRNPGRVAALILMSAPFRWIPAIWEELPRQDWEEFLYSRVPHGYSSKLSKQMVDMFNRWTCQENYLASVKVWEKARLEGPLRELQTPALVMQPCGNDSALKTAIDVADQLPHGRFAAIESGFAFGIEGEAIADIERFLAREGVWSSMQTAGLNGSANSNRLTRREVEVLSLLAEGKSNAQIADELVISQHTVVRHVANIFAKTDASNRTQAASYAHQHGLA
jgi:DNA-binding CsgD family transcriptional regulator/alpha-beta hydrolase superfamily lysophospholipase